MAKSIFRLQICNVGSFPMSGGELTMERTEQVLLSPGLNDSFFGVQTCLWLGRRQKLPSCFSFDNDRYFLPEDFHTSLFFRCNLSNRVKLYQEDRVSSLVILGPANFHRQEIQDLSLPCKTKFCQQMET